MTDTLDRTMDKWTRSLEQRAMALEKGNAIRLYRASIKCEIRSGERSAVDLLLQPAEELDSRLATMKVYELLKQMPRLGCKKLDLAFHRAGVSTSKTLGGITDRQRFALLAELERYPSFRQAA